MALQPWVSSHGTCTLPVHCAFHLSSLTLNLLLSHLAPRPLLQVTLVVNYDIPMERDGRTPNFETYLHRIGRSGRFGRKGAAFNLMAGAAVSKLDVVTLLKVKLTCAFSAPASVLA